jgi:8-oxo-dGTP pyrophosphatase MutT (NUDIX family)
MSSTLRHRVAPALRVAYRGAYLGMRAWSLAAKPRQRGVKCVVHDDAGRVVWVRHTYGDRAAWELPGGGAHRSESPTQAARREAREELGVDIPVWKDVGAVEGRWTGARLQLTCCVAEWPADERLDPDPVEIAATTWARPDTPPGRVGRVTAGVLPLLKDVVR